MLIDFKRLFKSFKVAFSGLLYAIKNENTFRAGMIIALVVTVASLCLPLTTCQKAIVFLTIFIVLGMELMNMQVEKTTNLIDKDYNPEIRVIKDLAAGAVLMIVIVAFVIFCLIFLPYIF